MFGHRYMACGGEIHSCRNFNVIQPSIGRKISKISESHFVWSVSDNENFIKLNNEF